MAARQPAQGFGDARHPGPCALPQHGWRARADEQIRTGGESRISNFLLWQCAYTELYFTDTLWPDFNADMLDEALAWYQKRVRRFGRTDEQVLGDKGLLTSTSAAPLGT